MREKPRILQDLEKAIGGAVLPEDSPEGVIRFSLAMGASPHDADAWLAERGIELRRLGAPPYWNFEIDA